MIKITESAIEQFTINLFERRDYQYNHCPDRAGLEPAPTKPAINIAYSTHAPTEIKTISEPVLKLKIFFTDEARAAA